MIAFGALIGALLAVAVAAFIADRWHPPRPPVAAEAVREHWDEWEREMAEGSGL